MLLALMETITAIHLLEFCSVVHKYIHTDTPLSVSERDFSINIKNREINKYINEPTNE